MVPSKADIQSELDSLLPAASAHAAADRVAADATSALEQARVRLADQAGELAACRAEASLLLEQLSRAETRIKVSNG